MLKVADVLEMAATILVDEGFENRTPAQLAQYVRAGLSLLALNVASQFTRIGTFALAVGSRQMIPADGEALLRVIRISAGPGQPDVYPRVTDVGMLAAADSRWGSRPLGVPRQVAADPGDPAVFWVHPPAAPGLSVEAQYKLGIGTPGTDTEYASVDSYYTGPLAHYVAACALMEDADYAVPGGVAAQHMQMFTAVLGAPQANA